MPIVAGRANQARSAVRRARNHEKLTCQTVLSTLSRSYAWSEVDNRSRPPFQCLRPRARRLGHRADELQSPRLGPGDLSLPVEDAGLEESRAHQRRSVGFDLRL